MKLTFKETTCLKARTLISDLRSKVLLGLQIEADEGKSVMPENLVMLRSRVSQLRWFYKE